MRRTVIAAVSAGAVLLAATLVDRAAAAIAEHRLATRLSCVVDVDVTIAGFPFLTQLASGTFGEVRVHADTAGIRDTTLKNLNITATGVRDGSAESVAASAVIDYASLSSRLGDSALASAQLSGDDAGRLVITASVPVRGLTMTATAYADLTVTGDRLTIAPSEVELAGLGIRVPASRLPGDLAGPRTVTLPALPSGVTYQQVSATPDGLSVAVTVVKGNTMTTINPCEGTE